nr:MAG TPA: MPN family protein [Caudoviricetes sp.]
MRNSQNFVNNRQKIGIFYKNFGVCWLHSHPATGERK